MDVEHWAWQRDWTPHVILNLSGAIGRWGLSIGNASDVGFRIWASCRHWGLAKGQSLVCFGVERLVEKDLQEDSYTAN